MDNRPIGVFDSGLGGLTAVKQLKNILPKEDIIYFGDTGRVPYGTKSRDTVMRYSLEDINFLRNKGVKAVIAACGTASSVLTREVTEKFDFLFCGVLFPTAKAAVEKTKNKRIGVIGTSATVKSNSYPKEIYKLCPEATVISRACPLFVPLVENGYFDKNNKITKLAAEEYLVPFIDDDIDTLILGCTHYPLLASIIQDILGDKVTLIDAGKETAKYVRDMLVNNDMLCDKYQNGSTEYYVSDSIEQFAEYAEKFLSSKVEGKVKQGFADERFNNKDGQ